MRRNVRVAASVLVLASLAVGCGGGGGGGSTSASTTATTSPVKGSASSRTPSEHRPPSKPYRGGEKSIEDFGSEAKGASREAVLAAFTGYLGSIAAEDPAKACVRLSAAVKRSLSQLSANLPRKGAGCAAALSELLAPNAAAIASQQANGKVTRVRVKGERAFVVFHAPGAKLYQLTMVRESGGWKATTVAASVLVPSTATLGD